MKFPSGLGEQELIEYISAQRWYGSKGREVAVASVVDYAELPGCLIVLVEVRFPEGTHETYQLVAGDELDGLAEPPVARELVHLLRAGKAHPSAGEGMLEFGTVEGSAGLGTELATSRLIGSEQSNTSVVFDEEAILKVYRRLEAGINPELEMLRFLTEHGFEHIAAARRLVRLPRPAARSDARHPPAVRGRRPRRLGARARRARRRRRTRSSRGCAASAR